MPREHELGAGRFKVYGKMAGKRVDEALPVTYVRTSHLADVSSLNTRNAVSSNRSKRMSACRIAVRM